MSQHCYAGSCLCGAIRYEVRGEIGDIATGVVTLVSRDLDIENSKSR